MRNTTLILPALLGTLLLGACQGAGGSAEAASTDGEDPPAAAQAEPSEGDVLFEEITSSWSDASFETCGPQLRDVLGTRDLVAGALAGVEDPDGKATAEVEDAEHWIAEGDARFAAARPALDAGECSDALLADLQETWQFYVKAGTSAVQAGQIAGG